MKVKRKKSFDKMFSKLGAVSQNKVINALELFSKDPYSNSLQLHQLKGKFTGIYSISAAFDLRVLFSGNKSFQEITLLMVGTHCQLYG